MTMPTPGPPLPQGGAPSGGDQPDPQELMQAIMGPTHGGAVPMQPSGGIEATYPALRTSSGVDWQKVNPRLLQLLDKEAQKIKSVIVIQSGYRSTDHNDMIGGAPNSPHRRGLAIDAFVNGHPLGEVIDPAKLQKLGLSVGGASGDPAHVEMVGIPIKRQGGKGNAAQQGVRQSNGPPGM